MIRRGKLERVNATPAQYLDRQRLHNTVFDGKIALEGVHISDGPSLVIGELPGQPCLVISQPWYQAADEIDPHPSLEAVSGFMQAQNFVAVKGSYFGWIRLHDGVIVTDTKPDNFVFTAAGVVQSTYKLLKSSPSFCGRSW